jgi:AcrR family transcriptional regulator
MELKERVLEAVIEEFNDKGLKFTMDDIAKRLGISKRTLYTVIQDKEELFLDMVDYIFSDIKASEKKIAEDTSMDVIEKLKKILIVLPQK